MTDAEVRALPLLETALSILLKDPHRREIPRESFKRRKTIEDNVRRAANSISIRNHRGQDEPSESSHVEETPYVSYVRKMNSEGVVSLGIDLDAGWSDD